MTNEELFIEGRYDELYEKNQGIIHKYIGKYKFAGEYEDLKGCADVAFTKALKTFDASKAKFVTYLVLLVRSEIFKFHRDHMSRLVPTVSLDDIVLGTEKLTKEDIIEDEGNSVEDIAISSVGLDTIRDCIKELDDRSRACLEYSLEGMTQDEISALVGTTQVQVSRMIKKARIAMASKLHQNGFSSSGLDKYLVTKVQNKVKKADNNEKGVVEMTIMDKCFKEFEAGRYTNADLNSITQEIGCSYNTARAYLNMWRNKNGVSSTRPRKPKERKAIEVTVEYPTEDIKASDTPSTEESITTSIEEVREDLHETEHVPKGLSVVKLTIKGEHYHFDIEGDTVAIHDTANYLQVPKADLEGFIEELVEVSNLLGKYPLFKLK